MGQNPLRNCNANEIRKFAQSHGFHKSSMNGDDEIWVNNQLSAIFRIPSRNEVIPIGTMNAMVMKSKISKKVWKDWLESNT